MSKVGRNDPCPCGSKKKFKKCHAQSNPPSMPLTRSPFAGPQPIKTSFKGKTVRAVGHRLISSKPTDTFHEFLIQLLVHTFGKPWLQREEAAPIKEQHVVVRWLRAWADLTKRSRPPNQVAGEPFPVDPTGSSAELFVLAYDVYLLTKVNELPRSLLVRLRRRDHFQGARYEVAIAATFVRQGFEIDWNTDKSKRTCEFTATHPATCEAIAVETKSRHRPGRLHEVGDPKEPPELRLDVRRLVAEAVDQRPGDKPFAIFVDLNLPPLTDVS